MKSTDRPSLSDRLKSLGVKVGTREIPVPKLEEYFPIEAILSGAFTSTSLGETFIHEERFSADYHHGRAPIKLQASLNIMSAWAADARLRDLPIESFAFLDTETSGLSGGTGTYAFLVGVGKFINDEFILQQFFLRDPSEESALLEGLGDFLDSAKALVTFNGKAFDAPLLVTRYTLHNIPVPFKDFAHLDLLPLARRLWRDRLESRALKYLEENILLAPRTVEEVPGYEIPYIYFDYLRDGDARPLKGVFYHNAMDVVAMAALLSHTAKMLEDPFHEDIEHGLDVIALAKLYEDIGQWDTAARLFERGLEKGISEENFSETVRRLSVLQKRRGDFDEAIRLWEEAAEKGHIYAFIELAKYYEHKQRDPKSALKWTKSAQKQIEKSDLPVYIKKHWADELNHRLQRLEAKLGK
ncbi:MAG: ribonuclease H-like domain-containing protein [Anaerolineales bacterium]